MKRLAALAIVLFSFQVTACALRGFGVAEFLSEQNRAHHTRWVQATGSGDEHARREAGCHGHRDSASPAEGSAQPEPGGCRSHCQLYAQGIPPASPQSSPSSLAPWCVAALSESPIHASWTLHPPTVPRAPPQARDISLLHAVLRI